MRILINPKHFDMSRFQVLIENLPHVTFTNDITDQTIDAMITWSSAANQKVLSHYPNLKLIMLPSAGYDRADIEYLKKHHIMLTNARGVYDIQIAEDVVAKILYFNRDMKTYQEHVNQQLWENKHKFHELYHQTVGIIGTGSIGSRIAHVMKGFDVHVIGYRQNNQPLKDFNEIHTGEAGLKQVLNLSDYVILAVPLNQHTHHIIDEKTLKMMKKNAVLINIARGQVIEQKALVKALNEGWIRAAALDVTEIEPLEKNDPLWHAKHIYITPHIAGSSPEANHRVNQLLNRIIKQYLANEPLDNRIC